MSSEWPPSTIGEFCPFHYGKGLPQRARRTGPIPVISSAGVVGSHDTAYVNQAGVIIGRKGTVGSITFASGPFWPIDTTFFIKDQPEKRDIRFVFYLLKTLGLEHMNTDSAVPGLNRENAHALSIRVPPLTEQKEIADFLQILDDRITLLRETNKTLESIAQTIFKSWFVDFDPVRAKMEGRQPEGIDEATAALFPNSFEKSELGLIPRGWQVGRLGDLMCLHKGTVKPQEAPKTLFLHYSLPAFDAGMMARPELGESIKSNKTSVPESAVLFSKLNPVIARVWLPAETGLNAICSTEFLPFIPDGTCTTSFIYLLLKSDPFRNQIVPLASGTSNSHQRVRPDTVLNLGNILPPKELFKVFDDVVLPLLEKVKDNQITIQTLETLRDTLLPRLISGKLRLPDAKAIAEEHIT